MVVSARPREAKRALVRDSVNRLRERRMKAGQCVRDQRDRGGPEHGPPRLKADGTPGELCDACHDHRLAMQRDRRRREKGGPS